jgi:beta-barrel assembly-enhancing protease
MKVKVLATLLAIVGIMTFSACDKDAPFVPLFSISDDLKLGKQVEAEIAANPTQYPVLDSATNQQAYAFLYTMRNDILNSGKIVYKDEFAWRLKIIKDDSTLNAFCTPGGYIYVYTGLIKYLDSRDQLLGVMGHEMAHADRRHTSRSMQSQYGVQVLLDIILGNSSAVTDIANNIYALKNSQEHEKEADEYSVIYLCPTSYNAAGAAGFFQKMIDEGYTENQLQSFFSTHPSPANRVQKINEKRDDLGCSGTNVGVTEYAAFKALIP